MENFRNHGLRESLYRYTKKDLTVIRTIIVVLHWLVASEKIFSSILNDRLQCWATQNSANTDAQFGFKSNHSTVDAIFILNSFIEKHLNSKKRLYSAFIDLKRAFDTVYRNGLWYKLIKSWVDGKVLCLIRSMYKEVKSCVRHLNTLSELSTVILG